MWGLEVVQNGEHEGVIQVGGCWPAGLLWCSACPPASAAPQSVPAHQLTQPPWSLPSPPRPPWRRSSTHDRLRSPSDQLLLISPLNHFTTLVPHPSPPRLSTCPVQAVIYARRRPDPLPHLFGYHEIFHTFVTLAALLHFTAVYRVVNSPLGAQTALP